jgi:hypothetical protein
MSLGKKTLKLASLSILAVLLNFQGCIKYQTVSSSELTIDAGFVCGWGSGQDSIEITRHSITYRYWIPARSPAPVINKTREVTEIEWEEISSYVNLSEFLNLDYNTCNVCVDGCDEWISVQNDNISHKITFDKGLKIKTISSLQAKLAALRAEFAK